MMILAQSLATELSAVAVGGAAICRLSGMHLLQYHGVRHRSAWVLLYLAMLLGAVTAVHEVMAGEPSLAALLLLAAAGTYLWQSRHTWQDGPPAFMRVERPGPAVWPWPGEPGD